MVEVLEIGLEDVFWTVFVALITIPTLNQMREFEEKIPRLVSRSCYVTLLNKGLWARCSSTTVKMNLSPFERFGLKATLLKDKALVEVTGFLEKHKMPFATEDVTLTPGNYQVTWNGSLLLVERWAG